MAKTKCQLSLSCANCGTKDINLGIVRRHKVYCWNCGHRLGYISLAPQIPQYADCYINGRSVSPGMPLRRSKIKI
jgi:DNA-directed RNA polymerase subunit RPC12/RpoP